MDFELYTEADDIFARMGCEDELARSEMTRWQRGFLCGLIKRESPHKILEIGVAAGGLLRSYLTLSTSWNLMLKSIPLTIAKGFTEMKVLIPDILRKRQSSVLEG